MIVEQILEAKQRKIKQYPVNANRASELGHECLRFLVLNRTRWNEKTLHDARLQMIFDMGNAIEDMCERDLRDAGFTIVEQHRPFNWATYGITGSIDMKLGLTAPMIVKECEDGKLPDPIKDALQELLKDWGRRPGNRSDFVDVIPTEIKSSAPHVWQGINTIDDIKKHKYHYMRKYLAQLTLYLLMDNKGIGLFLFKNKQTGEVREIWLTLDYEFGESLIRKAETINSHVIAGSLPDPIAYDENICDDCGFAHICLPERIGKEVQVIDDERLAQLLDQRALLMPSAKEFEQVDDQIKKMVNGRDKILVGDWYITGKWQERASYDIPDDMKAPYKTTNKYWKVAIVNAKK